MANIKILGDAAVVTSALKTEEIQALAKFKSTALTIRDKETKEPVYKVSIARAGGSAEFCPNGTNFNGTDTNGYAIATLTLPAGMNKEEKKTYIKDTFGLSILSLNAAEKELAKVYGALEKDLKSAEENVKFVDET